MEFICFFHPRVKGSAPDQRCTVCDRRFDFPTTNPPSSISGFDVESELGRGFYAVAYRVRHPRTGISFVMKVTPKAVYELPDPSNRAVGGYGDRRDFESECRLHASLEDIPGLARIADWGDASIDLGGSSLDVYWTQMELVRGETIEHYYTQGKVLAPRAIAQVAEDLLTLSETLHSQGIFHNDLHGGNAIIVDLPPEKHRRRAIDPAVAVRVFDLGSAARDDKADLGSRLSDLEQVSLQIHRLLDRFDQSASAIIASDVRLSAQLRRVAQAYSQIDWESRRVTSTDMLGEVRRAYALAVHPEQFRPIEFQSIQDHYNAQTLPSVFARTLIYDPEGQWTKAMTSAGPQLVVGMRGCGKTMLLRSLEWSAHAVVGPDEDLSQAMNRIAGQSFLGLFVSCAHLLRAPRERVGEGALQRLYLAYAREAIRAVQTCEVHGLGEPQPAAVDQFCELIAATVPTFQQDGRTMSLPRVELELSKAIQRDVPDEIRRSFVPLEAFTELAKSIRAMSNVWLGKTVLFLLDDVSRRFVNEDDLADLLTQFCLKSDTFGFKISTETQTQVLHSPSGERALEGRDYQVFHLGEHVLDALKGSGGGRFLEQILDRRQQIVSGDAWVPARARLGNRSLQSIAEDLRGSRQGTADGKYPYYGLGALAAVCVGDIGDVLQIFHKMTVGTQPGSVISQRRQHEALVSESRLRLLSLVKLDVDNAWYFKHSAAFASASTRELGQRDRLRQYSDIYVEVDSGDQAAFRRLMNLVDNGVYVIIGFRQRTKAAEGSPVYQFALRFRKLFGLNFRVPLSNRDRFELTGPAVNDWLENPRSEVLTALPPAPKTSEDRGWLPDLDEGDEYVDVTVEPPLGEDQGAPTLFDDDFSELVTLDAPATLPRTALKVEIDELPLGPDTVGWQAATLIAAVGFEDRAVGAISALGTSGVSQVGQVLLVRYPDAGNAREIASAVAELTGDVSFFEVDTEVDPSEAVRDLVNSLPSGPVVLDVSALTKPLIYCFTKELLTVRGQLFVTHTAAETYEPLAEELNPVLRLLDAGEFPEGLKLLDAITPGEGTDFTPLSVGVPWLDASLRSILVAFVTLKYRRLDSLLDSVATDKIIGVRTTHSTAPKGVESRAVGLISDYLVASQSGELRSVSAMDAGATYELLMEYYDQYVLDNAYRIELALTGTKMQTVGAAAFASVAKVANVLYSVPLGRDQSRFTHGTGRTRLFELATTLAR